MFQCGTRELLSTDLNPRCFRESIPEIFISQSGRVSVANNYYSKHMKVTTVIINFEYQEESVVIRSHISFRKFKAINC